MSLRLAFIFLFSSLVLLNPVFAAEFCREVVSAPEEPKPIERFEARLTSISEAVRGVRGYSKIMNAFSTNDVRLASLHLETLAKIYEVATTKEKDSKRMKKFRKEIKHFEDAIGDLGRARTLTETIKDTGLETVVANLVIQKSQIAEAGFIEKLKELDWLPGPQSKIAELEEKVSKYNFKGRTKNRARVIDATIELLEEIRGHIRDLRSLIYSKKYDEETLEEGPHELRRELRWAFYFFSALDALYAYGPSPTSKRGRELEKKYGDSKYLLLVNGPDPLIFDRLSALNLTRFVIELGNLKDFQEALLDLKAAIIESGYIANPKQAEAYARSIIVKKFGEHNVELEAQQLFEEYVDERPITVLIQQMKSQRER